MDTFPDISPVYCHTWTLFLTYPLCKMIIPPGLAATKDKRLTPAACDVKKPSGVLNPTGSPERVSCTFYRLNDQQMHNDFNKQFQQYQ